MATQPNVRCRTCMMKIFVGISAVNIFERSIHNISVAEILHSFISLTFDANDQLPKCVCHLCYEKLYSFYQFVLNIENVDAQFREELKEKDYSSLKSADIMKKNLNFCDVPVEHTSLQKNQGSLSIKKEICEEENGAQDTPPTIKFEVVQEYVCKICYKCFSNKGNYQRHIKKHSVCDENNRLNQAEHSNQDNSCDYKTGSIEIEVNPLEDNINSENEEINSDIKHSPQEEPALHTAEAPIKLEGIVCEICNRMFRNKNSMSAHMRKHAVKGRVLSCPTCGKVFNKFYHLKRHQIDVHSDQNETGTKLTNEENLSGASTKKEYMCVVCNRKFKSQHSLAAHTKIHINKDRVRACAKCGRVFPRFNHLKRHEATCMIEGVNDIEVTENVEVTCDICEKKFKNKNSLSAHMKIHVNKNRVLECSKCGKVFPRRRLDHLKRHELIHEEKRKYKCGYCKEAFFTEDILEQHLTQHNTETKVCSVCQETFDSILALNTHFLKLHRTKLHLCSYCGKKFESSRQLHQHHHRHMGIRRFPCTICPKKFITNQELQAHMTTHTGERSYKCKQCNATFTCRSALSQHEFRHLGIKPYRCDMCPKSFVMKNALKCHYRIHTGEKPYSCDICSQAFTNSYSLLKHRRRHLGDKLFKCDLCTESFRLKGELTQHINEHYTSKLRLPDLAEPTGDMETETLDQEWLKTEESG